MATVVMTVQVVTAAVFAEAGALVAEAGTLVADGLFVADGALVAEAGALVTDGALVAEAGTLVANGLLVADGSLVARAATLVTVWRGVTLGRGVRDGTGVREGRGVRDGVSVGPTSGTFSSVQPDTTVMKSVLTQPSTGDTSLVLITRHHFLSAVRPVAESSAPAKTLPIACCRTEGSPRRLSIVCAVSVQVAVVLALVSVLT